MEKQPSHHDKKSLSFRSRRESFAFAFSGFAVLFKSQKNFQLHLIFAVLALFLAIWLQIGRLQLTVIIFCIAMVLTAEALNTAIEMVVNMFSAQRSWPAKWAKDVAASAVLIAALAAFVIGLLILGPPLYDHLLQIL